MPPKTAAATQETVVDPNKAGKKYIVRVGESFQSGPSFTNIRYNDKPTALLSNPDPTILKPSPTSETLTLTLPTETAKPLLYTGHFNPSSSAECLLIFDPLTQEFTLEALDGSVTLNTDSTGAPPISSDNDDSEYSEPEEGNPYDFRHFIVKTPKEARAEVESPPDTGRDSPAPMPVPVAAPRAVKKKAANAFSSLADTGAKASPKPKKAPAKAAPKKAAPKPRPKPEPAAATAPPKNESLLLPASAPSPAQDAEPKQPKSLKELLAAKSAGAEPESDADDESGSDDEANIDFVVEGEEDDNGPKSLFGGRKPLTAGLGARPISLKKSPLAGGLLGNNRGREDSSEDEIMLDAEQESEVDAPGEEEDDEEDGFDELERAMEDALASEDEEEGVPTPAESGYPPVPVQGYNFAARRNDEESSSEEE